MRSTIPSTGLLAAALASLASAQTYNTSDPFVLQLSSDNVTIDGQYLAACHAGAAIEELCLAGAASDDDYEDDDDDVDAGPYDTFALNVSSSGDAAAGTYDTGVLVWTLETSSINVSEGLVFNPSLTSNVVAPEFQPGSDSTTNVGFDDDDMLFIYSSDVDEKNFTAGTFPTEINPYPLYQWYACYTYNEAYYYHTLAWVTGGPPTNPTCVAVNVTRIFV